MRLLILCVAASVVLGACNQTAEQDAVDETLTPRNSHVLNATEPKAPPSAATAPPRPAATPSNQPSDLLPSASTIGGDGSALDLSPLRADDTAQLSGELGCSFQQRGTARPILSALADVGPAARADAVVRIGGALERLAGVGEGGFGAMERGTRFAGRGLKITVARGAHPEAGGESPAFRATLTARRADGAERRIDGLWTCGP